MRSPGGVVQEQGLQYFPSPWTEFLSLLFLSTATRRRFRLLLPCLDPNQSGYVMKLYGGCLLCRRDVLEKVGWFDERYFMYAEDVDLCRAISDHGRKLYYLSDAEIVHIGGGSSEKAPSDFSILMKSESIAKLMEKHYGASAAWLYRIGTLSGSAARLVVLVVLRMMSLVSRIGSDTDFSAAFSKYRTLMLWALGLRRPVIAR
jgi:GT2 family glycosyltransferase